MCGMKAGSYCGKLYGSSLDLWVGGVVLHVAAAKSLQSCPTLNDPMDRSPPGSAVPGILQARTLEWGAIAFSGPALRKRRGEGKRPSVRVLN